MTVGAPWWSALTRFHDETLDAFHICFISLMVVDGQVPFSRKVKPCREFRLATECVRRR